MKRLFVVTRPNPYFPLGTFVEEWEDGSVQEKVKSFSGDLGGYRGVVLPSMPPDLREACILVRKKGLDFRKGGALG